jgi:hypothetical protein
MHRRRVWPTVCSGSGRFIIVVGLRLLRLRLPEKELYPCSTRGADDDAGSTVDPAQLQHLVREYRVDLNELLCGVLRRVCRVMRYGGKRLLHRGLRLHPISTETSDEDTIQKIL